MRAFFLELRPALGIDDPGYGVGEFTLRIVIGGYSFLDEKSRSPQPEPRRRSALLRREVIATSSAGVALSRSGPRNPRRALE